MIRQEDSLENPSTEEQPPLTARDTVDAIAAAMTAGDHDVLMALYAADVTFHSPVTALEFDGKDKGG